MTASKGIGLPVQRTRAGTFPRGVSGNPLGVAGSRVIVNGRGRPKGSVGRATKLGRKIKEIISRVALEEDPNSEKKGERRIENALRRLYAKDPRSYCDVLLRVLPKEVDTTHHVGADPNSWSELMILARSGPAEPETRNVVDMSGRFVEALPQPTLETQALPEPPADIELQPEHKLETVIEPTAVATVPAVDPLDDLPVAPVPAVEATVKVNVHESFYGEDL